jgi:hypothetical protein
LVCRDTAGFDRLRSDPATLEQLRCCWLLRVKAGKHGDKRILISDDFPGDRQWFD